MLIIFNHHRIKFHSLQWQRKIQVKILITRKMTRYIPWCPTDKKIDCQQWKTKRMKWSNMILREILRVNRRVKTRSFLFTEENLAPFIDVRRKWAAWCSPLRWWTPQKRRTDEPWNEKSKLWDDCSIHDLFNSMMPSITADKYT